MEPVENIHTPCDKCDVCGIQGPGNTVELYGTPVLFSCYGCDTTLPEVVESIPYEHAVIYQDRKDYEADSDPLTVQLVNHRKQKASGKKIS